MRQLMEIKSIGGKNKHVKIFLDVFHSQDRSRLAFFRICLYEAKFLSRLLIMELSVLYAVGAPTSWGARVIPIAPGLLLPDRLAVAEPLDESSGAGASLTRALMLGMIFAVGVVLPLFGGCMSGTVNVVG